MLVLSRRKTEAIQIGETVEIRVIDIRCGRVRLGIQAPKEIPVIRSAATATVAREAVRNVSTSTSATSATQTRRHRPR